jgi:hypothetical protein
LASIWPQWSSLPSQAILPTANGLSDLAATQPFVHSNPIFTPGTNGSIIGTWGGAPSAANVPQGWTLAALGTAGGITCVAEKGVETDPDGYPVFKLTFSGTLAAGSTATIQLYQQLGSTALTTALSAGRIANDDKLRTVAKVMVDEGSQLLNGVSADCYVQSASASRYQTALANAAVTAGTGVFLNGYSDACAGSPWDILMTELVDLQDPNLVALNQNMDTLTSAIARLTMTFRNPGGSTAPVSAVIRFSRAGMIRTAS